MKVQKKSITRKMKKGKFKLKNIKMVFNLTVKETKEGFLINAKDITLPELAKILLRIFDKRYVIKPKEKLHKK